MKLDEREIDRRLATLSGWAVEHHAITREFTLRSFPDAIAFVTRLAFDAEAAGHHPDLDVRYTRVRVAWSTHSAGGITAKDFDGAERTETIARTFSS